MVESPSLLHRHCPVVVATTGSCVRPRSSVPLAVRSSAQSLQVATSPCCIEVLPDVISAHLSLRAWTPTPAARVVHLPVSSHTTTAFPPFGTGRRSTIAPPATSGGTPISGLQSFSHVQARKFAHHPGRSYRCRFRSMAAVVSTSEPLVVCYLPTPRICYPSESGN
jgi:hypothetical protein